MDRVELQIRLNKEIGIHSLQFIHIDRVSLRRFSIHIASWPQQAPGAYAFAQAQREYARRRTEIRRITNDEETPTRSIHYFHFWHRTVFFERRTHGKRDPAWK